MIIQWSTLNALGKSKIVKSNYVWIFIIPLVAKNIDVISTQLDFDITLTFSITKLFYASIFFCLGTLVYQLRCPKLIKDYTNYGEFSKDLNTIQIIADYHHQAREQIFSYIEYEELKCSALKFDVDTDTSLKKTINIHISKTLTNCVFIDKQLEADYFNHVYNDINQRFKIMAFSSFCLYLTGIVFLLSTSVINVIDALKFFKVF